MPTQRNFFLLLVITIGFIFAGCERDDFGCADCPVENWEQPELLPPITLKYLDAVQTMGPLDIANIYLPNGLSVNDYLQTHDADFYNNWQEKLPYFQDSFNMNTFIARVTLLSSKLTDRSSFQFPAEGPDKPAQNGLAYVYGSDDFTSRRSSLESGDGKAVCSKELYGMDGSGLFKYVMERSGIRQHYNTIDTLISRARIEQWLYDFSNTVDYRVVDFGQQPLSFVKPGDIIYWKFSHHQKPGMLGIVVEDQYKELGVLLSSGSAYNDCERNYSPSLDSNISRGPRLLFLKRNLPLLTNSFFYRDGVEPADGFGGSGVTNGNTSTQVAYNVIRIMPVFAGTGYSQEFLYYNDTCEYHVFLSDLNLDLNYYNDERMNVLVSAELQYTFNQVSQNCPYYYSFPQTYRATTQVYNNYLDLDFGIGHFIGILKENTVVGDLNISFNGYPFPAQMILYPK